MMTTVQNHIKELLFEQDCVVIPDFGGFVTNFECAKINSNNTFITPPQKWLAFNVLLKNDDGLLSSFICKHENISHPQANLMIKSFVEGAKMQLDTNNAYAIEGLGVFTKNQEWKIQFQAETSNNFYGESFGMENVFLRRGKSLEHELQVISNPSIISKTTVQQVFVKNDREPTVEIFENDGEITFKRNRLSKVLPYIFAAIGSIILASSIYLYDNKNGANLSSINPFQSNSVNPTIPNLGTTTIPKLPRVVKNNDIKPVDEVKSEPILKANNVINKTDNRFFIITGSFGKIKNAKKLLTTLINSGFADAEIIYPKSNEKLIKVSAGGFHNESDAEQEAIKVENTIDSKTWIYKY